MISSNNIRRLIRSFVLVMTGALTACASLETSETIVVDNLTAEKFGVLVMAHGGSDDWNKGVENSLNNLRSEYPVEIAFGMADAGSIENGVRNLEAQGVEQVGVVRLFISGESWRQRTAQILGIENGAPVKPTDHCAMDHCAMDHGTMPMGFWKIDSDLRFYLSEEGLSEAQEMDQVLLSRVRALSTDPTSEVVVIIAHGPADDEENARWISEISERTKLIKREMNVRDVQVFTLREDWEQKREGAEELIRKYVKEAGANSLTPIVVPFRVHGFGPYASVLAGLNYNAEQKGLIPHTNVVLWIKNQVKVLRTQAQAD
jgi:sirohydrochlorin cobaltochelatase